MATSETQAAQQLRRITKCSICLNDFTDPRMLTCIHTFCFECLERVEKATEKKPGDEMPCPLCRKKFTIPEDGLSGIQKNFFLQDLMEVTNMLTQSTESTKCDICKALGDCDSAIVPEATMRCWECQDNFCDRCSQMHQVQKLSRCHKVVEIGGETEEEIRRIISVKTCTNHNQKPLDYYCADCKKIVCVSCFLESHKLHDCKDVATVDKEFRQTIEKNAWKISNYADELLSMRKNKNKNKEDFLEEIVGKESIILQRNQELKEIIDRDTKLLLDELSVIKSNQLKQIESEMEEIDRSCTIFRSFETYCTELRLRGSASDICSSFDQLIASADDLEKDHESFIGRPHQSIKVSFEATDLKEVSQKFHSTSVGQIKVKTEATAQFENYAIVIGLSCGTAITNDVVKINLHRPNEISYLQEIPTIMRREATATVFCNTIYVTGIGANADEIWKYSMASSWMKCATLAQGRRRHSAAFIDEVLYICGGFVRLDRRVLDSVEAYNALATKSKTVGRLVHCVQGSGNCVPYKNSLYIFGGTDKDNDAFNHVQMYDTKRNICTLLSTSLPGNYDLMRATLWKTYAILLGCDTCFIFDFERKRWLERNRFKTDVDHFGLILENGRIFITAGGIDQKDENGETKWKCRDEVRYVPLQNILDDKPIDWKVHSKLSKPSLIGAGARMRFPV